MLSARFQAFVCLALGLAAAALPTVYVCLYFLCAHAAADQCTSDRRDSLGDEITSEVDSALNLVETWRDSIVEEIRGRTVQHRRFFPQRTSPSRV